MEELEEQMSGLVSPASLVSKPGGGGRDDLIRSDVPRARGRERVGDPPQMSISTSRTLLFWQGDPT